MSIDREPGMIRSQVFDKLVEMGVKKVVVGFTGGHDEGGVDSVVLTMNDGKEQEMPDPNIAWDSYNKRYYRFGQGYDHTASAVPTGDELLHLALIRPVFDKYHTFAGEFSVEGQVVWDVEERTASMRANEWTEQSSGVDEEV